MSVNPKVVLYKYLYSEGVKPLRFPSEFLFFMLKIQILCVKSVKTVVHNLTVTLFK